MKLLTEITMMKYNNRSYISPHTQYIYRCFFYVIFSYNMKLKKNNIPVVHPLYILDVFIETIDESINGIKM